ncbi:MAG: hypothetical protein AB8H80_18465 [Planctomycetota bacterium]
MRLEPVYLLGPKKKPPSVPTRRAFMIAGSTFIAGLGLGGACGYAAGTSASGTSAAGGSEPSPSPTTGSNGSTPAAPAVDEALKPTGDAMLDDMRRLAVKAPIEELVEKRNDFIDVFQRSYSDDPVVWRGLVRLANAVIEDEQFTQRRFSARWIGQQMAGDPQREKRYGSLMQELQAIR